LDDAGGLGVSYQGTEYARGIRGVNSGEKAILMQLGARLDQRTNRARASNAELARDAEKSPRQVGRIMQRLGLPRDGHPFGIVKREDGGLGRNNVSVYSFVGFRCQKGDILCLEKRTSLTGKGDILAGKVDIGDTRINRVRAQEELQKKKPQEREKETTLSLDDQEGGSESDLEWAKRIARRR
jgi:hypothetical protein